MELNKIYNESNLDTLEKMEAETIDIVLTSPFYNTNLKAGKDRTLLNSKVKKSNYHYLRYDVFVDNMSNNDYMEYCAKLFNHFNKVLKKDGVILWNVNYGSENTDCLFLTIAHLIQNTNFSIGDVIVWKKKTAIPNSASGNKLTRIWEFVFVFCRKDELKSFNANKKETSKRPNGQVMYENIYNFIEAANNDESCPYNKATYSTELCTKLLNIYGKKSMTVYDPFMGSGTTALACQRMGINYIGSEISENQVKWAENRLKNDFSSKQLELF